MLSFAQKQRFVTIIVTRGTSHKYHHDNYVSLQYAGINTSRDNNEIYHFQSVLPVYFRCSCMSGHFKPSIYNNITLTH
jgi:hypothetical protein